MKKNQDRSCHEENGIIITPSIQNILDRASSYLESGFPVHFSGPTGTGKSTLAHYLAQSLGQPIVLMFGDDDLNTSDLIGNTIGFNKRKMIDNFIHSVLKTEEEYSKHWVDNRLTHAVKNGCTLIYDEFNRSRPEANNILLSVLEDGILSLPTERGGNIQVHPDFRAIFTSNSEEYAGVHKTQDALLDRMVTLHIDYLDEATEQAIVGSKTGLSLEESGAIVKILRGFRESNPWQAPITLRPGIVIGTILSRMDKKPLSSDPLFFELCMDALFSARNSNDNREKAKHCLENLIHQHSVLGEVLS